VITGLEELISMPVKSLRSGSDLLDALNTKAPLGYVVVYVFEDGTPVHKILSLVFEEVSRRCPFSVFFMIDVQDVGESLLEKLNVVTFPTFLVVSLGQVKNRIQVSTKEGLISQMKKAGVLQETEEITNV